MAALDRQHMATALSLAAQGRGLVEPNPLVGCVVARGAQVLAQGWHQRYGGPHAEAVALRVAQQSLAGATLYVTLEPCCHQGQTPPCTDAVIAAHISRVVVAIADPFPRVSGKGIRTLREAGLEVELGLMAHEASTLNAPYLKLIRRGRPWIIAKWAMSLDGKLAARSGDSKWISSGASREVVHRLRGRVDAILVGLGTARADDPQLTARPPGPRAAHRIVVDSHANLPLKSRLVQTARDTPVLVVVGPHADQQRCQQLTAAGCEVFVCPGPTHGERLEALLDELGRRRFTNVLVEGGSLLFGALLDADQIDEVHLFLAPKLVGGAKAIPVFAGLGAERLDQALRLHDLVVQQTGDDLYIQARLIK